MVFSKNIDLQYRKLQPDFELFKKYEHIADDDAFISMDAHAALCYFCSRQWRVINHPSFLSRMMC